MTCTAATEATIGSPKTSTRSARARHGCADHRRGAACAATISRDLAASARPVNPRREDSTQVARAGRAPRHQAEDRREHVADENREGDGADAGMAAEQDADGERDRLDRRTHRRDADPRAPVDPGHPTVARAWAEIRGEIQRARERNRDDADSDLEQLPPKGGRLRQDARSNIERKADHDHVPHGSQAGPLAQRDPAEQDDEADDDRRAADVERRPARDTLREHRPRRVAEACGDQRSFADPEEHEAGSEDHKRRRRRAPARAARAPGHRRDTRRRAQRGEDTRADVLRPNSHKATCYITISRAA